MNFLTFKLRGYNMGMKILNVIWIVIFLGGCAAGQTIDYRTGSVDYETGLEEDHKLLITFQDIRPYVLSGNKRPSFVGLNRSLYGIPYSVSTRSNKPLADDLGTLVAKSLQDEGLIARSVAFPLKGNVNNFIRNYANKGEKVLLFSIHEWKTDASFTASLYYDIDLTVYNDDGREMATSRQAGHDAVGANQPPGRRNLAEVNVDILGGLMKMPVIKSAISNENIEASTVKTSYTAPKQKIEAPADKISNTMQKHNDKCSVQQVLSMKEAGLSDNQVKAACK